jgi:hypothetical protein
MSISKIVPAYVLQKCILTKAGFCTKYVPKYYSYTVMHLINELPGKSSVNTIHYTTIEIMFTAHC